MALRPLTSIYAMTIPRLEVFRWRQIPRCLGYPNGSGGIEMIPVVGWPPTPGAFLECPGEFCAVWLYVNGGVATGIVEQYLP